MKYIQHDNIIGNSYLKRLQTLTQGMNGFPWFFLSEDVAYSSDGIQFGDLKLLDMPDKQKTVGFTHLLLDQDGIESPFLPVFQPLLDNIQDRIGYPIEFFRVRLALQLNNGNGHHNGVHTDNEQDHYAALYYLHDSSGDTVFFNEYDIYPTKDMMIIFPSWLMHAVGKSSSDEDRISISFNIMAHSDHYHGIYPTR